MTRGDGGQNLIGPEIGELLGIIRSQELLAARRIDGLVVPVDERAEPGRSALFDDRQLEREVAIKVLPRELASDPDRLARFEREMEAVGKLEHPHLVRAMDAGESEGVHFLVMEYVEGPTLHELVSAAISSPLDRARPLWQVHYFSRVGKGSALLVRVHHSLVDGSSAVV